MDSPMTLNRDNRSKMRTGIYLGTRDRRELSFIIFIATYCDITLS